MEDNWIFLLFRVKCARASKEINDLNNSSQLSSTHKHHKLL